MCVNGRTDRRNDSEGRRRAAHATQRGRRASRNSRRGVLGGRFARRGSYRLNKTVTAWGGYTHDSNYSAGHFTVMEHRAREQVTFDNVAKLGRGRLSGRVRLEQRWREGIDGTGWRVRPYLKYTLPLRPGGRTALVLSSEPFFNLNRTSFQRSDGFDRVRNLIAVTTPITKNITAEIGYLNQYTSVRHGPDTDDHVASVVLSLSL